VTEPVRDAVPETPALHFTRLGDVQLKGFKEPTTLYVAQPSLGGPPRRRVGEPV
jgi:class 3 adenylate cyclase